MFEQLVRTPSDINEHLEALRDLASECRHVTEMGVRYIVSTWAFVEGLGKGSSLVSIDIVEPSYYGADISKVERACEEKGIRFKFIKASTLEVEIERTDLLFIDTLHTYGQLKSELMLHADKARKYIVLHDTTSCPEMWPAVEELLAEGKWKIRVRYAHNNGVTVLERC